MSLGNAGSFPPTCIHESLLQLRGVPLRTLYSVRVNLNVKVHDFVRLVGPIVTIDRTVFEMRAPASDRMTGSGCVHSAMAIPTHLITHYEPVA